MEPFLERLARILLDEHGNGIDRIAVVLPSRRAGTYLRRYLAKLKGGALWSPDLYDPGAFMERISGVRQGTQLELLFMLNAAHRSLAGSETEPLSEFLRWAPTTLRDMSEIDAHLLSLDNVYRDLRAYHEIEQWSLQPDSTLSPGQERMVQQWSRTGALHRSLHGSMEKRGIGTSGAVARKAVSVVADAAWRCPWSAVRFAGLNALDPAMTAVVSTLQNRGLGKVAWDADHFYLDDEQNAAGRFLRRSIKDLGPGDIPPVNNILEMDRSIEVVNVPDGISQTYHLAHELGALSAGDRSRSVVVLADEQLLLPLLIALPHSLGPLNVTMGLTLSGLPVKGLLDAALRLHAGSETDHGFALTAFEDLLRHPFLHQGSTTTSAIVRLRALGATRVSHDAVLSAAGEAGMEVTDAMVHAVRSLSKKGDYHQCMLAIVEWARQSRMHDPLVQEQLFRVAVLENDLQRVLDALHPEGIDRITYAELHDRALRGEQLTLFGEPVKGLQIMGLLETRALDFERAYIVGASDATLPGGDGQRSWIPFEVRRAYGLPLRADSDAIAAYHVHRLLHKTGHVQLIWDMGGADGSAGPTRYIAQWKHSLRTGSRTTITEKVFHAASPTRSNPVISITKDAAVMERLNAIAASGFSPSALGTWLRCPLDFYFSRILGIRPPEEPEDLLGSDVLGSAVHEVLEEVYRPHIGKVIEADALRAPIAQIRERLTQQLRKEHSAEVLSKGHFRLRIDMAAQGIKAYLEAEAERCKKQETIPRSIEEDLVGSLNDGTRIRGFCDRIELRDGLVHILDLKTGGVRPEDLALKSLSREAIAPDRRYALQLLIYAWLAMRNDHGIEVLRAGIVPLRQSSRSDGIWLTIEGRSEVRRDDLDGITALLSTLVNELMDRDMPFRHDPDSAWCACCLP